MWSGGYLEQKAFAFKILWEVKVGSGEMTAKIRQRERDAWEGEANECKNEEKERIEGPSNVQYEHGVDQSVR